MHVFILPHNDFVRFGDNYRPGGNSKTESGWSLSQNKITKEASILGDVISLDTSQRSVVVVDECPEWLKDEGLEKQKGRVRSILRHEILHTLMVANKIPYPLNEGIIEWYAVELGRARGENVSAGYQSLYSYFNTLRIVLINDGLDEDDLDRALLANDPDSKEKITQSMRSKYGKENTERILEYRFKNGKEACAFLDTFEKPKTDAQSCSR